MGAADAPLQVGVVAADVRAAAFRGRASFTLGEIEGRLRRFLVKKLVEHIFSAHHNIRRIAFVGEAEKES